MTPVYSPMMGYGVGSATSARPCVTHVRSRKFVSSQSDSLCVGEVYRPATQSGDVIGIKAHASASAFIVAAVKC
jgi:hypothetical protein